MARTLVRSQPAHIQARVSSMTSGMCMMTTPKFAYQQLDTVRSNRMKMLSPAAAEAPAARTRRPCESTQRGGTAARRCAQSAKQARSAQLRQAVHGAAWP